MKRPTNHNKGKTGIIAKAVKIFRDAINSLELTETNISSLLFINSREKINNLLCNNFTTNFKVKVESYDNIKRFNNIVNIANRLFGIDLNEYKIVHKDRFYFKRDAWFNQSPGYVGSKNQVLKLLKIK